MTRRTARLRRLGAALVLAALALTHAVTFAAAVEASEGAYPHHHHPGCPWAHHRGPCPMAMRNDGGPAIGPCAADAPAAAVEFAVLFPPPEPFTWVVALSEGAVPAVPIAVPLARPDPPEVRPPRAFPLG